MRARTATTGRIATLDRMSRTARRRLPGALSASQEMPLRTAAGIPGAPQNQVRHSPICPTVSSRIRFRRPFFSRLIRGDSRGEPHGCDDRATSPEGWQSPVCRQVRRPLAFAPWNSRTSRYDFGQDVPEYSASVTCSIQVTLEPSSASWIAMWVIPVSGAAPCQWRSSGANQTTSPERIS